jgi:hypothetical protein
MFGLLALLLGGGKLVSWSFGGSSTSMQKGMLKAYDDYNAGKITEEEREKRCSEERDKFIAKYSR